MKYKFFTRGLLAVLGLMCAVCFALGLHFTETAFAADGDRIDIESYTLTLDVNEFTYSGLEIKPTATVNNGTANLVEGTDYTISYENNVEAGTATVKAEGKGDYTGTLSAQFTINPATDNAWQRNDIDSDVIFYGSYNPEVPAFTVWAKYGSENAIFKFYDGDNKEISAADLATADAGEYKVTAQIAATGSYNAIEGILTDTFRIYPARNNWTQAPKVVEWEYGKFDATVNLFMGVAEHGDVRFTISNQNETFIRDFTVNEGVVTNQNYVKILSDELTAGKYTLSATVNGGNNYQDIPATQVDFEVRQTSNDWMTFPDVVEWQYGNYNKDTNLFLASVNYGTVWFKVKTAEDGEDLTSEFTAVNGIIQEEDGEISNVLSKFEKGKYYVSVRVDVGDANREEIHATGFEFDVIQAANGWQASPNVIAWEYGGYNPNVNLIIGTPLHGTAKFVITDGENNLTREFSPFEGIIDEADNGDVLAIIKDLHAGDYYLVATVASDENGNYSGIESQTPLQFTVNQAVNDWKVTPSIESWVKGKYNAEVNFVTAEAEHGVVDYVIYKTTDEENVIYQVSNGEVVVDNLAQAGVGYYTLKATVAATDDFSGVERTFTFNVFAQGLPWWAIVIIVVGALGITALVFFILHQKGVLQMLTEKVIVAMRTKMTVDATIAAVRANKVAEAAKRSVAAAEEEERRKAEQDKNDGNLNQ